MLQSRQDPFIVRIVEQPARETSIADVILGSLGLVGVMVIAALVLGLLLGGGLILVKRMTARDGLDPQREADNFRVTPS